MAEAGHPAGQGSPSIEMELDGQAERPSLGTSSASSTVSYYESISDELDTNSAPFQLVQNRKRRKASTSSESSDKTVKTMNRTDPHLTVIVRPKDPDKVIATINPKKIQEKLDMTAPDGVILVRPNRRLNVLAIDTRNRDATKALLALTTLDGIAVLAYEPLPRESAAGVIYEVPADLTEVELQLAVRTTAPVISIRRLGKSETVKLVFSTDTLPDYASGTFHFPELKPELEKYQDASQPTWKPAKGDCLCTEHFEDEDYKTSPKLLQSLGLPVKQAYLKHGVVPSLFTRKRKRERHSGAVEKRRRKEPDERLPPIAGAPLSVSCTWRDCSYTLFHVMMYRRKGYKRELLALGHITAAQALVQ
ncbi:hypothetical protein HPB47_021551 [Ixodes persulcatus]|uniref:Uncharacterized protein n=1 Tax=Ixodes persulcatus TaxID=34615 RepID=A0AC60QFG8_IXOPE|nr:hypothetical protein HPB47_021551 [Ixodes persulcatus]